MRRGEERRGHHEERFSCDKAAEVLDTFHQIRGLHLHLVTSFPTTPVFVVVVFCFSLNCDQLRMKSVCEKCMMQRCDMLNLENIFAVRVRS